MQMAISRSETGLVISFACCMPNQRSKLGESWGTVRNVDCSNRKKIVNIGCGRVEAQLNWNIRKMWQYWALKIIMCTKLKLERRINVTISSVNAYHAP